MNGNKEFEIIEHHKIKHINAFLIHIVYRNFHMHSDFELLFILDGSCLITLKDSVLPLSPGDSIIINPCEMHEIDTNGKGITAMILQFSGHFCFDYYPSLRNTRFRTGNLRAQFSNNNKYSEFVAQIKALVMSYYKEEDYFELNCVRSLITIVKTCLCTLDCIQINESEYYSQKKRNERIQRISSYIDDNYLYPIQLKDLAALEQLTVTHMSHFFKENFGVTFQEYITGIRLEHALLIAGKERASIAALSELSGFSDPKYLSKAFFAKFGYSIKEYINDSHSKNKNLQNNNYKQPKALQTFIPRDEALKILQSELNQ